MTLKKNQDIELNIHGCTAEGSGVGKYEGITVFVSGAAPGDTLITHIIKVKKTYAVGIIKEILIPSPDRIPVDCPYFTSCGGCVFRHISYEAEKRIKKQRVEDAFHRIGHIDIEVGEVVTSSTERYRNKAQYPVGIDKNGKVTAGFYAFKSHRIVGCDDCLLQPREFAEITSAVKEWAEENGVSVYDGEAHKGLLRHIYIRKGFATGETALCLVINGEDIPKSQQLLEKLGRFTQIKSVVLNINREKTNVILGEKCKTLWGREYIEDKLCSVRLKISPNSFYQVNHGCAQLLYEKTAELCSLTGSETVLDLYCGTGSIGLSMAEKTKKIIGVEIVPDAVKNARENAEAAGILNAEFYCMDAFEAAKMLKEKGISPDVVILDPPRKGCDRELLKTVSQMSPEKLVYVSCDVATQARDCQILETLGYKARKATPVDMFPRTGHVETVVLMSRVK